MAGKTKNKVEVQLGCGLMGRIFHLKTNNRTRKSSVHSLPVKACNNTALQQRDQAKNEAKPSPNHQSNVPKDSSIGTTPTLKVEQNPARKSSSSHRAPSAYQNTQNGRASDAARTSIQRSHDSNEESKQQQKEHAIVNSLELATISPSANHHHYHQNNETKSPAKEFVLPITGNLLHVNSSPRTSITKSKELNTLSGSCSYNSNNSTNKGVMGNIMRKNSDELAQFRSPRNSRVDPEVLKSMGNEAYKQGRFEEALALYDRAIAVDSKKATYHCNKSAALIGLGRFLHAIVECEEAIKLENSYGRAHTRLATIYFRLGEAEKALNCNETSSCVDSVLAFQAQALQNHLSKCTEARKVKDWKVILKETQAAISLGADSAPLVYSLHTEALLKLLRHQEAHATYEKMPKFDLDCSNKLFGPVRSAYLLMIGAQIYLAAGRFEDAVTASQQAAKLDPSNFEVNALVRRARAVTSARMSGNLLFKASKFTEAYAVYNEGLEHDPHNSVLLCNRAACRSKLGQFEKAIEDCNVALIVQPSYSKARLRRADCNAKLERWEAAIQDYEMLLREKPGDEEVARALFETQLQLKMLRGEDIKDLKFGSNLFFISSNDRFRHYVTSPGMSVVLFCNKATHKQVLLVLEQTCKRFPSVNFLKVEIEDHPYLAKSECVNCIPAFKIYKNGSRIKEIPGNNHDLLEKLVKLYSS